MQDGEIQNKTIKIVKVEDSAISTGSKKKTITDQDSKRYSFFLHTKEGIKTKTYEQFLAMELGVGSTARIGFVTETFELKSGKDAGKMAKVNKIISFSEPFDQDRAEVEQPREEFEAQPKEPTYPPHLREDDVRPAPPSSSKDDVWEAKDRLHAAQTAANFVATVHQGTGLEGDARGLNHGFKKQMDEVYAWLLAKKSGVETTGEDISVEDIPFA